MQTTKKKSILLVDDEVDLVEVIKKFLEEKYKVITAFNGQEALFKAQNEVFDLIITDVHMPKINGIRFIKEIRKSYNPSTIIISGHSTEIQNAIEKMKGLQFLAKPFEEKDLLFLVVKLLSQVDNTKEATSQDQITVTAGDWLFKEGDFDDNIYWVIQGNFDVLITDESGEEVSLGHIGKDEFIGEMSAIEQKPRSASIRATEDSIVLTISNKKFLNVFEKQPIWLQKLIKALSARLRSSIDFRKHH
jgi:YesN/AraC family two-component response regulator